MFHNKVILITGASCEIETAAALLFVREGGKLAIVGNDETTLNDLADRCELIGARPLVIKADISVEEEAKTIIEKTVDKYKKLDVLINNASFIKYVGIIDENLLNVYDEVMNINMRAVIQITNLAVPHIIKTKGNIVNVSSMPANDSEAGRFFPYFISAAAIHHYTRELAAELEPRGVRVNVIKPGPVIRHTPVIMNIPEEIRHIPMFPIKSDTEENAGLLVYLACDIARNITGSSCIVTDKFHFVKL